MARIARPEEAECMRAKLIHAAFDVMVEKGCNAFTLGDVAHRAGVSKGLPLYYFRSKNDLLHSVIKHRTELIIRMVERAVQGKDEPLAQLQAYFDAMTMDGRMHRNFYLVYLDLLSQGLRNPEIGSTAREFLTDCLAVEKRIIASGIASGDFRQDLDPEHAAAGVRGLFDGSSVLWIFHPDEPFESFRARLQSAVLEYLLA